MIARPGCPRCGGAPLSPIPNQAVRLLDGMVELGPVSRPVLWLGRLGAGSVLPRQPYGRHARLLGAGHQLTTTQCPERRARDARSGRRTSRGGVEGLDPAGHSAPLVRVSRRLQIAKPSLDLLARLRCLMLAPGVPDALPERDQVEAAALRCPIGRLPLKGVQPEEAVQVLLKVHHVGLPNLRAKRGHGTRHADDKPWSGLSQPTPDVGDRHDR